uniref:Caspase domain-containing protein n=1 Tax=Candidatus Kentrum sp. TUN TaxID=2126343 RepID=A0A451APT0_9GAMM|nr:MAG: Caspase domain-containing protein [Candidatus Kentron sp. TUN]VFK68015.1 MAG: Caspase domain-containing protein [Candidatus Kentron sp. TUN]
MNVNNNRLPSILFIVFSLLWMGLVQADTTKNVFETDKSAPIYIYASQSGKKILKQGRHEDNPFASALIELLARHHLTFGEFSTGLVDLTLEKSRGFQQPDISASSILDVLGACTLQLLPKPASESRVALILAFSDYSGSNLPSLPGAKADMSRMADALVRAGFREVRKVLDPNNAEVESTMRAFAELSKKSDMAVLYTAGHGIEVEGNIYLIPGNYPFLQKNTMLDKRTIPLVRLGSALQASRANFIFYSGGRNNPFGAE